MGEFGKQTAVSRLEIPSRARPVPSRAACSLATARRGLSLPGALGDSVSERIANTDDPGYLHHRLALVEEMSHLVGLGCEHRVSRRPGSYRAAIRSDLWGRRCSPCDRPG